MRPPLSIGTILQNRYRLLSILGQGGFGRTYLAEDQGRFNELCALKELIPAQGDTYTLDKSKELFQREAQILYQIQHPQIPQFRATFEQDQRLYLVQDYVEGQTYRTLLDQRKTEGTAFSEAEVLQLLRQLLPVLAHIHAKGIIHRDIAPDNIIRRERDGLPVLIDFGVVREIATRLQSPATVPQNTTVGKPGYAPSEQMQTGRAYPSSDLYSLAVTAVVLLTGKEPQELFDDTTLTWYWQRWVTIDPSFAQVLNRMLSYRPGDRYQSVSEVVQALQAGGPAAATQTQVPPVAPSPPPAEVSHMQTVAVGRRPEPTTPAASTPSRPEPSIPSPRSSLWDDPLAVAAIGTGLVLLTGIGSWAVVRAVLNANQSPSPSPTETIVVSPTPKATVSTTPSPKPTVTPITRTQLLTVIPDKQTTEGGTLKPNETLTYLLSGDQGQQLEQGQQLRIVRTGDQAVTMTVLGPDERPIGDYTRPVSVWQGVLPSAGTYYIRLTLAKGFDKGDYQLNINLRNPVAPSPSPTVTPSTPSPASSPTLQTERIVFPAGATATTVADHTTPAVIRRYIVSVKDKQILGVAVKGGAVTLDVRTPDGRPIDGAAKIAASWEGAVPQAGDYQIDVVAAQDTDYKVDISVRD